jgi:hypothetical protein
MQTLAIVVTALVVAASTRGAGAQEGMLTAPVTIDATVFADAAGADAGPHDALSVGFVGAGDSAVRWLGVTALRVQGHSGYEEASIVNALRPASPNLLISGIPEDLARLRAAPVGERLRLDGMLDVRARRLLLTGLVTRAAARPAGGDGPASPEAPPTP